MKFRKPDLNTSAFIHFVSAACFILIFSLLTLGQKEIAISQVQGSGDLSPVVGQQVRVTGIATARTKTGFFLQTPDEKKDNDLNTSEGIFVFTGSRNEPPAEAASEISFR